MVEYKTTMRDIKICAKCKYFIPGETDFMRSLKSVFGIPMSDNAIRAAKCSNISVGKVEVVAGKHLQISCVTARNMSASSGGCGPEGKHFIKQEDK